MAAEAPLNFALNVKERPDLARLAFNYAVTTPANDTLGFSYTIDRHDFNGDAWKQLGARVEMDLGDGVLVTVPASERPATLSITGSLEGFGVRELTCGKIPGESPLRTAWMRAPRRVKVTGVRGTLGGFREWDLFDGLIREGNHSLFPSAASLQAQDASVLNERLFYTLAPFSYRSRRSIIAEICNRYGIRAGTWTFTDVANVGGYVMKGINEFGERTVLEFFGEFLIPTTCRPKWRGGVLNIQHFTPSGTSKRTLTWSDIREIRIPPPPTNAPNTVRFTAEIYPYVGPDLTGTHPPVEEIVTGSYTPAAATQKQNHLTGAITAVSPSVTPQTMISKRVTVDNYAGGTLTTRVVTDYAWYAPKACKNRINGGTAYNNVFDVYQFPDGTWRTQDTETFMIVQQTTFTKSFNATTGRLDFDVTYMAKMAPWEWHRSAILFGSNGTPTGYDRLVTVDGDAWINGCETVGVVEHVYRYYNYDAATGQVSARTNLNRSAFGEAFYGSITPPPIGPTYTGPNIYEFGPAAALRRCYRAVGSITLWRVMESYIETSATTHSIVTAAPTYEPFPYVVPSSTVTCSPIPPVGTVEVAEPRPIIEQTTYQQTTQSVSITTPSLASVALVGKRLADYSENGWCETRPEMEASGLQVLRQIGAIRPELTMHEVDFDLEEGDVITLPYHPDLGDGPVPALIVSAHVGLDGQACSGDQRFELEVWPREVA